MRKKSKALTRITEDADTLSTDGEAVQTLHSAVTGWATAVAAVVGFGGTVVYGTGIVAMDAYAEFWGLSQGMFPRSTESVLIIGLRAWLVPFGERIAKISSESMQFLGIGLVGMIALVVFVLGFFHLSHWLSSRKATGPGSTPHSLFRPDGSVRNLALLWRTSLLVVSIGVGSQVLVFALVFALVFPLAIGENYGRNKARNEYQTLNKPCADERQSSAQCVEVLRNEMRVGLGHVVMSSPEMILIFDPKNATVQTFRLADVMLRKMCLAEKCGASESTQVD